MTLTTEEPTSPAESAAPPAWRRKPVAPLLLIWAVLTGLLTLFSLTVPAHLMGAPASDRMAEIESTVTVFSVASAPVAALVWAIALYSLFSWRHRGTEAPGEDAPALRGHGPTQVIWAVASSVLCLFLLVWGLVILHEAPQSAEQVLAEDQVDVTGQQWAWNFTYPQVGNVQSQDLYLPVDTLVTFNVKSLDVVHSFWIVEMGTKIDANPGEVTHINVTPNKIGVFNIRCAELCGLYHSYMQTQVHVLSRADYDAWAAAQRQLAAAG